MSAAAPSLGVDNEADELANALHADALKSSGRWLKLETPEDVNDSFDTWVAAGDSREMKSRKILYGTLVTLFDRGMSVCEGRGRGLTNALANALENLP